MSQLLGYQKVRFVGYAIPTTPAEMIAVGDPNGTGSVAGTYRANPDTSTDIDARVRQLKNAVDSAVRALPAEADPTVLTVFVAPEFYWHGTLGPYVFSRDEEDPAVTILTALQAAFPVRDYPHFLFVFGSVITTRVDDIEAVFAASSTRARNDVVTALGQSWRATSGPLSLVILDMIVDFVKNCHAYPNVEVRNRALIVSGGELNGVLDGFDTTVLTTEKYYDSNEDFLLWDVTNAPVITEQMTAYPVLDLSGGDFKTEAHDSKAIFRVGVAAPANVAVEICLDHTDRRLRKSIDLNPWPERADGIDLHIVPSCGMQLHPPSVAARAGGWAFNCDGQYALGAAPGAGTPQSGEIAGVICAYADYVSPADTVYAAHSQLARVSTAARMSDEKAPGALNAMFDAVPEVDVSVVPVLGIPDLDGYFAGGAGAVHVYGAVNPLPLRG
jgi:hypothetical protein